MKTIFFFSFLALQLFFSQFAISAETNYYLEIKKKTFELGEYSNSKFKKKRFTEFRIGEENANEISRFLLADSSEKVLIYFHSMWGGMDVYHSHSLKKINKIKGVDKIISIVWHTEKLGYKGSWKAAVDQGQSLQAILEKLTAKIDNQYFVLCHSMGNRIFEGAVKDINGYQMRFEAVFFAAADLEIDVFSNNLEDLSGLSKKMVVYVHEKDRLLKLSKIIHKRNRLGLNIADNPEQFNGMPNLEIVNITKSKEGNNLSFSNHIYFKNHQGVLRDIEYVINNQEEEREKGFKEKKGNYIELK